MANNLFISYDLIKDKNYDAVISKIKTLGDWTKFHYSYWYVNSNHTTESAAKAVWSAMDADDKLIVVDATNGQAYWYNLPDPVAAYIKNHWER